MDKSRRRDKQAGVGVGGRLRQRLAQMLLHTSCAATNAGRTTNAAAEPPLPARPRRRGAHAHTHDPPSSRSIVGDGRRRDTRALLHVSVDCSARSPVAAAVLQPAPVPIRSKGKGGGSGRDRLPHSPSYGYGWSWSSSSSGTDTDGEAAPFSSDGEREEEEEEEEDGPGTARSSTLFSSHSRSFSSDSVSDLCTDTNNNGGGGGGSGNTRHRRQKKNPPPPLRRRVPSRQSTTADTFRPTAGSTAVVKRSRNPYADFRSSMAEMVAGRRIRGADALSELLVWYLSLNSPRHHPAILAAFEDVWEAVLGGEP